MAFFTRMAWYDASQNDTEMEGFSFRAGVIPKHWSSCGHEEWKKPGYFHCIHCSVCSDPQNEWIYCYLIIMIHLYVCKGGSKTPKKNWTPRFFVTAQMCTVAYVAPAPFVPSNVCGHRWLKLCSADPAGDNLVLQTQSKQGPKAVR